LSIFAPQPKKYPKASIVLDSKRCAEVVRQVSKLFFYSAILQRSIKKGYPTMLSPRFGHKRSRKLLCLFSAAAIASVFLLLIARSSPAQDMSANSSHTPNGWILTGSKVQSYLTGVDPQTGVNASPSAYLMSRESVAEGFGTLMQNFSANHYLGKRVRLTASVRTEDVGGWAGLWMRVDKGAAVVAFDNMMDRSIRGTTSWQRYQVVLDVPEDASGISFGGLLNRSGKVWLSGVEFEVVGTDIPTTGGAPGIVREGPTNLDFRN
jgi:hypothetical protein